MVKIKVQAKENDNGTWTIVCPEKGCDWKIIAPDKHSAICNYGTHKRHEHIQKKKIQSPSEPRRTYSSGRIEEEDLRNTLIEAGVPERSHDGICRMFFEHGAQTPRRLNQILQDFMVTPNRRKIIIDMIYGEGVFTNEYLSDAESQEESYESRLKKDIKRMELLNKYMLMKNEQELLDGKEKKKGEKRKYRRLADGSTVKMTDSEWAEYKIALSSGGGNQINMQEFLQRVSDGMIAREIKYMTDKIHERMTDLEQRLKYDDFTRLKYYQELAKKAGLLKTPADDTDAEITKKIMEKKIESLDKVVSRAERFLDRVMTLGEPLIKRKIQKVLIEDGDKPPQLRPVNEDELECWEETLNEVARGSNQREGGDIEPTQRKRQQQEEN